MKSLLISSEYFPPQVGGISRLMGGITAALGPERVCCLTSQRVNDIADREDEDLGVKVYRRPAVFNGKTKFLRGAAWVATITEIMVSDRPKVVQLATAGEGPLGLWLRRWLGLPFVVYAHGNEVLNAILESGQKLRLGLQRADRVVAVSRFTASLVQKAGVSPDRIEVVHPGCDSERFRPLFPRMDLRQKLLGERHKDKVVLSVGNLVARKGHDMVLRALPRLRETVPDVTYLIIGEGSYRPQLENLAIALGVRNHVVFAGRLAKGLPDIYALADVFVMPSREQLQECDIEGFGLVFLEASACAKPVVGGRSGGIPDAVADGLTGMLVDPHDSEEIANALVRLLTDEEFATRLGQQGRSWVLERFTWDGVGDKVQGILESVWRERSVGGLHRPACPTDNVGKTHRSNQQKSVYRLS